MNEEAEYGLSIGDVMSALLMIIILVMMNALSTLREESEKANQFDAKRKDLYQALYKEFETDFESLYMTVDTINGVIQFNSPSVLFDLGKSQVKSEFKDILNEFYPRYMSILLKPEYKPFIHEIRVEGHTSSDWYENKAPNPQRDYLKNLELSQFRSFSVLYHLLQISQDKTEKDWFQDKAVAIGYSSSELIYDPATGAEDPEKSRRVSFRAMLDYEQFMVGFESP
jgi:outer membrane protein OmpA-like peptidoglycan-associated protein